MFIVPLEIHKHTMMFFFFGVRMSTNTAAAAQLHAESYCNHPMPPPSTNFSAGGPKLQFFFMVSISYEQL